MHADGCRRDVVKGKGGQEIVVEQRDECVSDENELLLKSHPFVNDSCGILDLGAHVIESLEDFFNGFWTELAEGCPALTERKLIRSVTLESCRAVCSFPMREVQRRQRGSSREF
ncbi:hypothetical protein BLNAU_11231 [Blattamonas nauphoetae]|uniref:Gfo/Idh/MocA-like oxidoreductase C-terminal domain-containing protein n=1 Tax=Blattamonas nauphoetae TaxID=2049346 RepID=A0ABQ9XN63_9EUKA|nr:hypothetical protein BLNAU_11231 [Blattamonas nauphoetae]